MRGQWLVATLLVAFVVGIATGCDTSPKPTEPRAPALPAALAFRCGQLVMPYDALANPLGAEDADLPAARALKAFLNRIREPGVRAPEESSRTFRVLIAGGDAVVFGSDEIDGPGFATVIAERDGEAWKARTLGQCDPTLDLGGLGAARWQLEPGGKPPGPDVVRITAHVSEVDCAGGQAADGRIVAPAIIRRPDALLVVFAVVPVAPAGQAQACPAPAATPVEVDLGGPLGARELFDGSVVPPAPAWHPDCCG